MVSRHAPHAIAALLLAAGLVACKEPGVAPKPPGLQQGASNLRDWHAAALRMVKGMADQGFIPSAVAPAPGRTPFPPPYYVNVVAQGSTFLDEIKKSIERDLLSRGLPVARTPINATVINLDLDVVQWGPGTTYPGGALTALGLAGLAGTAIGTGGPLSPTGAAAIGAGALTAADVGLAVVPDTRTELVWRASVLSPDRVLMLRSETLYISGKDTALYVGSTTSPPIASPGSGLLGPTRPLLYAR